ncbi:uncharacterized protein PHACADRAFT_176318 [Phanerochaete carnosa HHB-10118-sp]|uniref:Major facilitator superfamily (MFS) profile domain-containing protein n=1 Tax=Phanerochaete carnosa (strain HHB-10118-sp) TaxID=650164 RepID=K5VZR5_PHACS|nr:uncharacterized protein PHACADRAFT_176318 [Phanerochaete carnosa HHB-10118-sp]EKM52295.1 hypothetical protein PHACADRAFT_176318 [Phanerochaete carnosa HHB-10118-sp]
MASESRSSTKSDVELTTKDASISQNVSKDLRFALVFVAICASLFLSALEYTAVATTLPTIVHDLNGQDFVWIASAYALAATALLPTSGGLAEIFGRRIMMLGALAVFALGSALCGAAKTMNWLIAARTVQGAGGGAIMSITSIIVSDLVPLRERAMYNALIGLTWGVASAIGPLVGGALANGGKWRWLFYLNLPISGVAAALVFFFLHLKTPEGTFREKISRMDWVGNFLIVTSSTATVLGLTWGGVQFAWTSAQVLVPLILGLIGIVMFLIYEAFVPVNPIIPFSLLSNRTSFSGYLQTFLAPIVNSAIVWFMATYFQACRDASPIRSAVDSLGLCLSIGPALIVSGIVIAATKTYRVQLVVGWIFYMVATGALSTLTADSSTAHGVGFLILMGIGSGILFSATYFPVLAPLPVSENAHALALFAFFRSFAGVWGVTIGTAVLQTQLTHRLPAAFLAQFPGGVSLAYAAIPAIRTLDEPLKQEVRVAFAQSLRVVWEVSIGIAGLGLLSTLLMKGLPLHTQIDEKWALEEANAPRPVDVELEQTSELPRL